MSTAAYSATAEAGASTDTDLPTDIVNGLAVSPHFARDGICFAARSTGLYRSDDGGGRWRLAYDSLGLAAPLATISVVVSPAFADDRTLFAGVNGGILRSTDGGAAWQIITLPEPAPLVTTLAVSPGFADDGLVFAGTLEDGVFRSSDHGRSWAAWNFGLLDRNVLTLAVSPHVAEDETLFAGTGSGLFRSSNGGRSWRELPLPVECATVLSVAVAGATLVVGTEGTGCFASEDGGRSWRRLGQAALEGAVNTIVSSQYGAADLRLLVLLDDTLVRSDDGGASWSAWPPSGEAPAGIAAVAATGGLEGGSALLAGLYDGAVVRL